MPAPFRLLLLSATPFELDPTVVWLRARATFEQGNVLQFSTTEVEVLFTGVGVAATAYTLGHRFASAPVPDLAIQAGIGGAIDRTLPIGSVVQVTRDCFGDFGAEEKDGSWLSLGDIKMHPGSPHTAEEYLELPPLAQPTPFTAVTGITVAQATGTEHRLRQLKSRWPDAQVESMEGAPFFKACLDLGVNPVQIRSISNYVEVRDRESWKISEAVRSLNDGLKRLLGGFV